MSQRQRTASAFALWTMATKLALALAVAAAFVGLGVQDPGAADAGPVDAQHLMIGYVVVPVLLKLVVIAMLRAPLTRSSYPHGEASSQGAQQVPEQG